MLTACYALSFLLPLVVNNKPLLLRYEGRTYTPLLHFYPASTFGGEGGEEPNYRSLAARFKTEGKGFALMPLYPYHPNESLLELPGQPPHHPSRAHWCGTDNRGRDVLARLLYGFRISISFALITTLVSYVVGITIGALLGYYGGRFDISVQRLIEIWSAMPFLYTMIIISSILQPNFALLVVVLTLFGWMGMTYYVRGEFYREKAKDYVAAAIAMGASNRQVIFRHILPNALTPGGQLRALRRGGLHRLAGQPGLPRLRPGAAHAELGPARPAGHGRDHQRLVAGAHPAYGALSSHC